MGKSNSKNLFTQWDLDRFSNVTGKELFINYYVFILILLGIPRDTVHKLYQEFITSTGKDNQMDKKEFRRLYKALYLGSQPAPTVPAVISEHDLEKISDNVFKAFDAEGSGNIIIIVSLYLIVVSFLFLRQIDIRR
jgi:hypothetical protein